MTIEVKKFLRWILGQAFYGRIQLQVITNPDLQLCLTAFIENDVIRQIFKLEEKNCVYNKDAEKLHSRQI